MKAREKLCFLRELLWRGLNKRATCVFLWSRNRGRGKALCKGMGGITQKKGGILLRKGEDDVFSLKGKKSGRRYRRAILFTKGQSQVPREALQS